MPLSRCLCWTLLVLALVADLVSAQRVLAPARLPALLDGLMGWWRGVPGLTGADRFYDLIGRQDAILSNMGFGTTSGWAPSDRLGGTAHVAFDGVDDYAAAPDSNTAYAFPDTTFTVMLWFRATTFTGATYLVSKRLAGATGTDGGWFIRLDDTGTLSARILNSGNVAAADRATISTTMLDGTWRHAAVLFTTNTTTTALNDVALYIGGVLNQDVRTQTSDFPYLPCTCPLTFGALSNQAAGSFVPGAIDDVRIYSRALSVAEIGEVVRLGPLGDPSFAPGTGVAQVPVVAGARGSFFPFFP